MTLLDKSLANKLENQLAYIISNSSFYRNKFIKFDQSAKSLVEVFTELPLTTKSEVLVDQQSHSSPFGSNLCTSEQNIKRVHKTSGTTNRPVLIALTENDIKVTVEVGAQCFKSSGLKSTDTVIHCLNYNMWAGGYTDHQSLEATGAAVIPFGVGNSRNLIETILWLKPTAIHCTPSYLAKLEIILKKSFSLTPKDLNLKLGLFGAESGLQHKEFRNNIEQIWGLKAMNANYGMSDMLSMFGAECSYQNGLHFMGGEALYPELIDYRTGEILPVKSGVVGELVLTNLEKEAQPLVRYRTNDVIKILSTDECNCGQTNFRFEVMGRSDDMIVIKGVNVFVSAFQSFINKYLNTLTGVWQILVNEREPVDRLVVKMEIRDDVNLKKEMFIKSFVDDFKDNFGIKPELQLEKEGTLIHTSCKAKKILRIL